MPRARSPCENDFDDGPARTSSSTSRPSTASSRGSRGSCRCISKPREHRSSAGIMGRDDWAVGRVAVAANQPGVTYTFGMLALNETACKAIHISGTGTVNSAGNVQANSDGSGCGSDPAYRTQPDGRRRPQRHGAGCHLPERQSIQDAGVGTMTCTPSPNSRSHSRTRWRTSRRRPKPALAAA